PTPPRTTSPPAPTATAAKPAPPPTHHSSLTSPKTPSDGLLPWRARPKKPWRTPKPKRRPTKRTSRHGRSTVVSSPTCPTTGVGLLATSSPLDFLQKH